MTLLKNFLKIVFIFSFFTNSLYAVNTSNAKGSTTVYALSPQEVYNTSKDVWGFVAYQDGFDISKAPYTLSLGVASPIKGGEIKITNGGFLELLTDLEISSTVKLTIGSSPGDTAYIIGNKGAILCNGGLTIPDNRNLRFEDSDTVIDCKGNFLNIGSGSRLIIDSGITLTLRNAIITGLQGVASGSGAISLVDNTSCLALQNVVIDLSGDYKLDQGWLFIHNDVTVRGDGYKFIRSSVFDHPNQMPTIINNFSRLTFERDVTFEYDYRSSVTTRCRENLIFKDFSSVLYLNNCVVSVPAGSSTYAGLFLRDGSLILDNLVTFSNYSGQFINKDPQKGVILGNVQDESGAVNLNLKVLSDSRSEIFGSLSVTKANFV